MLCDIFGYGESFEFYEFAIDAINGRNADFDMQVRDPHSAFFLKVSQHIEDAPFAEIFGRIDLRRSGVLFRHISPLYKAKE